jgi:hypothetical protein
MLSWKRLISSVPALGSFAETRAFSLGKRLIPRIYIEYGMCDWISPARV